MVDWIAGDIEDAGGVVVARAVGAGADQQGRLSDRKDHCPLDLHVIQHAAGEH